MARGHFVYLLEGEGCLLQEGVNSPFAQDEVRLYVQGFQRLQEAHAENRAGRSADADDESGSVFVHVAVKEAGTLRLYYTCRVTHSSGTVWRRRPVRRSYFTEFQLNRDRAIPNLEGY